MTSAQISKIPHESAKAHVTGQAEYIDDRMQLSNEVFVDVYYSPVAHGKIRKIDYSEALKIEGVLAIYQARDLHLNIWGNIFHDQPYLADELVQYVGEPILIITANRRGALLLAKKKISIEIDELAPILSIFEARKHKLFIGPERKILSGDPEKALAEAPHRLKGTIKMQGQDHFYLESQACIAYPKEDGQIEIHSSSQHPSEVQQMVAEALGLKFHQVVCVVKRMGGAFGGKESQAGPFAVYAALVSKKLNRPARLILTKDDDMMITGKRNPFENEYEVGFDDDGKITALKFHLYSDGGAYADLSTAIMERAMLHSDNAYYIPNMLVTGQVCKTHTAPNTAFRGFGGPKGMLTVENVIEEIAIYLKKDSFDIRQSNTYMQNDKTHYGQEIKDNILPELYQKIRISSNYDVRRKEISEFNRNSKTHIRGLAATAIKFGISFTTRFLNQANALVNVFPDGTVQVSTGATEMGQGVNTKIAQIVADSFSIDITNVRVMPTSTEKNANTSATAASSGSDLNGRAVEVACEIIKFRLSQVALQVLGRSQNLRGKKVAGSGTAPEILIDENLSNQNCKLNFENNNVIDPVSQNKISFIDLLQEAYLNRISLSAYGFYRYPGIYFNKETGQGEPFFYFTNGTAVSEVIVDRYTGEVKVLRSDILMDLGRPLNKEIDMGQVSGAFVQGLGWLTTENLFYNEKGVLKTHSPSTYKIPSVHDIPRIFNIDFIENSENKKNLKGSKAVGEPPLMLAISVWAAIKNAIAYQKINSSNIIPKLSVPATQEAILMSILK
ncbi:MAG: molybdopterin cofactor-binding domain-containing protein [Bdellovibrionota bacterium]